MNFVLFGPPAAGKGTQAKTLAARRGMVQLSTGDMLRAARSSRTALGLRVAEVMDRGELVSDEIVIGLIGERLPGAEAAGGAIFDGFPRTLAQAEALEHLLVDRGRRIDRVVNLRVEPGVLVARMTKRFTEEGRADDNTEAFRTRLETYTSQTEPLIAHYARQGRLSHIDGTGAPEQVTAAIEAALA